MLYVSTFALTAFFSARLLVGKKFLLLVSLCKDQFNNDVLSYPGEGGGGTLRKIG